MRNRSGFYFVGFIIAIFGFLVFDYSARRDYLDKTSVQSQVATAEAVVAKEVAMQANSIEMRTRFLSRFKNFVTSMNAISDDPDQSEEFLQNFSQAISNEDIVVLNDVLNDLNAKNSERTLALELMVMNQDFMSHNYINNFAQNENFSSVNNQEFELSLRAQAIEGLAIFSDKKLVRKNLENLRIRTRFAFLHDRATQAIQYLSDRNLTKENVSAEASSP